MLFGDGVCKKKDHRFILLLDLKNDLQQTRSARAVLEEKDNNQRSSMIDYTSIFYVHHSGSLNER